MVLVGSKETQEWYTTDSEGCFALVLKGSADDDSGSRSSLTRTSPGKLQEKLGLLEIGQIFVCSSP